MKKRFVWIVEVQLDAETPPQYRGWKTSPLVTRYCGSEERAEEVVKDLQEEYPLCGVGYFQKELEG
jgi:hypothetical protein